MTFASVRLGLFVVTCRFRESECGIDAYLERFERFACSQDWSRDNYAVYLSALLEGPVLEVYHRLIKRRR